MSVQPYQEPLELPQCLVPLRNLRLLGLLLKPSPAILAELVHSVKLPNSLSVCLLSLKCHLLHSPVNQGEYSLGRRPVSQLQTPLVEAAASQAGGNLGQTLVSQIKIHLGNLPVSQADCSLGLGLGSRLQPNLAPVNLQGSLLASSQSPASLSGSHSTALKTPLAGRRPVRHSKQQSKALAATPSVTSNNCLRRLLPLVLLVGRVGRHSLDSGKAFRHQQCNKGLLSQEALQCLHRHQCQVCEC
jgi:hypothetical protein